MKELGLYLKAEREKQGLGLEDLASRTKIHIQKLRDIEEGNKEALPAKVFCIGLVKSYARELKVDLKVVDQLCQDAFAEKKDEVIADVPKPEPLHEPSPAQESDEDELNSIGRFKIPKIVGIAVGILVCGLLLVAIVEVVEKMNSYSQEEALPQEVFQTIEKPSDDLTTAETGPMVDEQVEPSNSGLAKNKDGRPDTTRPQPEPMKSEPIKEEKVVAKAEPKPDSGKNDSKPETVEKSAKQEEKISKIETQEDFSEDNFGAPDPSEDNKPEVAVSNNKLTVTALEPVRAEVVWSDGYVQVMLLKSQESKTLVFSKPITLRVNNGGAVQVSFNESEKKVPGTFNQPIEIKYP